MTNRILIGLCVLSLILLGCFICNDKSGGDTNSSEGLKFWHTQYKSVLARAQKSDQAFKDSILLVSGKKESRLVEFRTKIVKVPVYLNSVNDTIRDLAYIIQDADTIIQYDSLEIALWKARFDNQKALNDTMQTEIPKLDALHQARYKSLRRTNAIILICGAVLGLSLLVR